MKAGNKNTLIYFIYLVVFLLIASAAVLLWPVYRKYRKKEMEVDKLREAAAKETAETISLKRNVHDLIVSPEAVEKVAREKFGLCKDGETVLRFDPNEAKKKSPAVIADTKDKKK
jgi:cell division protein FtsB